MVVIYYSQIELPTMRAALVWPVQCGKIHENLFYSIEMIILLIHEMVVSVIIVLLIDYIP